MSELWVDLISRTTATIAGIALIFATTVSLLRTVVVPRSLRSIISGTVATVVIAAARVLARLPRTYHGRDSVLAWAGPLILLLQLVTWLVLYLIAYSLVIYGVGGHSFGEALGQAGSSLFTLGFIAATNTDQTAVDFIAAATGPIVIALMIGFLPTIYSSYLEREVDVTMLSATAGEPAWGPELVCRFALADDTAAMPDMFASWARWAAALRLTHVTYPVLVWVRSARYTRHYAIALLAILDAAALKVALNTSLPRKKSFEVLLHGTQTFDVLYTILFLKQPWKSRIPIAGAFFNRAGMEFHRTPGTHYWDPRLLAAETAADRDNLRGMTTHGAEALIGGRQRALTLTREEFDHAVELITRSGFPIERELDEAWDHFRQIRGRYEYPALQICYTLDAPPAPWSGPRRMPTPTMWPTIAVELTSDGTLDD